MIKAIIVEDELSALKSLQRKVIENCKNLEIVATSQTVEDAIAAIYDHQPQIIFLDVHLGDLSGFDVLARIKPFDFEVIFTTSYVDYAIPAIKADALDFLLKPIQVDELKAAVSKAVFKITQQRKSGKPRVPKLAIPVANKDPNNTVTVRFLDPEYIIYCKADDRHSILNIYRDEQIRIHRKLGELEEQICNEFYPFVRTHRSYIINVDYVEKYTRERLIILSNGDVIPLAGNYRDKFWECFEKRS